MTSDFSRLLSPFNPQALTSPLNANPQTSLTELTRRVKQLEQHDGTNSIPLTVTPNAEDAQKMGLGAAPHYKDSRAMWSAVTTCAKTEARVRNTETGTQARAFVADRFLARVFALPREQWVLTGEDAVLTRIKNACDTKDLNLLAELEDGPSCRGGTTPCSSNN